jgi:hypothetical protein
MFVILLLTHTLTPCAVPWTSLPHSITRPSYATTDIGEDDDTQRLHTSVFDGDWGDSFEFTRAPSIPDDGVSTHARVREACGVIDQNWYVITNEQRAVLLPILERMASSMLRATVPHIQQSASRPEGGTVSADSQSGMSQAAVYTAAVFTAPSADHVTSDPPPEAPSRVRIPTMPGRKKKKRHGLPTSEHSTHAKGARPGSKRK